MAVFETWLKCDLKKPVIVKQLPGTLFLGDEDSNLIGVEITDNANTPRLSGSVYGYIIRDDDETIVVQGTLTSGCKASIILPATAYAVPGMLSIVIKIGSATVGACVAKVYRAQTDTIADPDNIIPSVEELIARMNAAMQASEIAVDAKDTAVNAKDTAVSAAESAARSSSEAASSRMLMPATAIPIPASGSSASYDMADLTEDYYVMRWNYSESSENHPPASVSITTYNGYFTITNNYGTTSETVQPIFGKAVTREVTTHTTT